jgi:hypothetical protein
MAEIEVDVYGAKNWWQIGVVALSPSIFVVTNSPIGLDAHNVD